MLLDVTDSDAQKTFGLPPSWKAELIKQNA
jgi:hypothetical protein